jgi:hypothetical protein
MSWFPFGRKKVPMNGSMQGAGNLNKALRNYNSAIKALNQMKWKNEFNTILNKPYGSNAATPLKNRLINGVRKYARSVYNVNKVLASATSPQPVVSALNRAAQDAANLKGILTEIRQQAAANQSNLVNKYRALRGNALLNGNRAALAAVANNTSYNNNRALLNRVAAAIQAAAQPPPPPPPGPTTGPVNTGRRTKNTNRAVYAATANSNTYYAKKNNSTSNYYRVVANNGDLVFNTANQAPYSYNAATTSFQKK